ncbi:MAG: hypothetical protein EDM77_16790 [Candidatus Jettenia sp. AMX1]|nr:MAG: hypothetical protein EDM77_16790 [Candidatus Jettenia sp. AMX1]MCE7882195.1 hypothetical protein [Candidatus Jettenia sp. AMX1]MCQ3928704.1 hypothetical protein [Candidatus Jettenia sp.]
MNLSIVMSKQNIAFTIFWKFCIFWKNQLCYITFYFEITIATLKGCPAKSKFIYIKTGYEKI